jgi:4-hydroxy 2-oxovalerate aldolase
MFFNLVMVEYHDLTLRDGCHAISHKLTSDMIKNHCIFAEKSGIPVMEIGHGNGLGASSILIGKSELTDIEMISLAKHYLKNTKLSVHVIPGLATIERDIIPAIELGVDIFRIASHCTEASMTKTHIEYLVKNNKIVYGALMMCATCPINVLVEEVRKMKSYGASAVIIMDSTGSFYPEDVEKYFTELSKVGIKLGFHAHNNMGLAVSNSLTAIKCGAEIIDATVRGFGAGAGNTPLEIMSAIHPCGSINVVEAIEDLDYKAPTTKIINILTAKHKLHSVFEKKIVDASQTYKIPITKLVEELGNRKLVAGQEDLVRVIASQMTEQ